MEYPNPENYSPFEVLTKNFGQSETAWDDFSYQISSTPVSIQDLVLGITAEDFIIGIVTDFNLSENQSKNLALIIGEILMGDLFIGDLAKNVGQKLNIDQVITREIVNKIANELFAPAIEDIKKIQREKFPDRIGQGSTNAMPQPPAPPQIKNAPPVNQSNVIDLRQINPNDQ